MNDIRLATGHGPVTMQRTESPLGCVIVAVQDDRLAGIWFEGQKHFDGPCAGWRTGSHPVLDASVAQLHEYFGGSRTAFELPMLLAGTPFQQRVWQALLDIPFAGLATYGDIAARIGAGKGVRAVGAAVGRNPISVMVPCHRVIGANGKLTGYAGGLDRKRYLLDLEQTRDALC